MQALSGLLKSSNNSLSTPLRKTRSSSGNSPASEAGNSPEADTTSSPDPPLDTSQIGNLTHLESVDAEDPDLKELNHSLEALAAIFPNVQVEVFREMLQSFNEDSRLAVVTETLLKNDMRWVRGRYRVMVKEKEKTTSQEEGAEQISSGSQGVVAPQDRFRSTRYKKSVKGMAYHEFKGLSKSTINAVLAESNYSYTLARPTLVGLSSKSWRYSFSSFLMRRKPTSLEAEHHPAIVWQSTGQGSIVPTFKPTGSTELDQELYTTLVVPIKERVVVERTQKDHTLALELNNTEAEDNQALHDCECCFTSTAFEQLSACDDGGHFICFNCVRHSLNEAVFGQGWQRNIDLDIGTLRCVAAMSDDCKGNIPQDLVRRAFDEDKAGKEVVRKFDERLAEDSLLKTRLPLIRCPFCSYAEIDELYLPDGQRSWRLRRMGPASIYTLVILILSVGMIPFLTPLFVLFSFLFILLSCQQSFATYISTELNASVIRLRRKRHGLKFICQNEECGRGSCISCSKAWTDIHICHESSILALRTQVELAMSLAIKRTCPRCQMSFVKSSGCNKLTCVCGYQMCYVCRKDIGSGEGYRHFCEHFRPNGGRGCTECKKCDLYRCEDDEIVVKRAKEEAEKQWVEKEGGVLGGEEKVRRVVEREGMGPGGWLGWVRKWPGREEVLDGLVECLIE